MRPTSKLSSEVIEGFVRSVLQKRFDNPAPIPACHREWWDLCTGKDMFVAIAAPRGFAKSTAITFSYVLSTVLFRERKFVLIISDTESQAIMFLQDIKNELIDNDDLRNLFGIKGLEKDSESDIICIMDGGHRFRIMAKGSEQKLRGVKWDNKRPDLIVCDDLENDEIVMNKDRRDKFKRWFRGALVPCRSDHGIIRIVGTILHLDSLLENLMPKPHDKATVITELKMYSTKYTMWKAVKYKAHSSDFSELLWPEKKPAEVLKQIRKEYTESGMADVYSQEYLNVPLDESNTYFRKSDFLPMKDEDYKKPKQYYISADLAISLKQRSDYSAFVVGGVDEDKRLHIVNVVRERMDAQEIVSTILGLQKTYQPELITIESGQIAKAIGPFLREQMIRNDSFGYVIEVSTGGEDKLRRARSIQGRMRAGGVKFDKQGEWYQTFEDELMRFPRDVHDDQVDAFAYLGLALDKMTEAPTAQEMREEAEEEELRNSGFLHKGINKTTGY